MRGLPPTLPLAAASWDVCCRSSSSLSIALGGSSWSSVKSLALSSIVKRALTLSTGGGGGSRIG